jgi:ABC-type transporter Mla subunit MlaD
MNSKTNHFKIGLFVLSGVILLIAGLLLFGMTRHFEPKTRFETYVTGDVEGLSVGSAVKYRGVQVGTVTGIRFSWNEYPEATQSDLVVVEFEMVNRASPTPVDADSGRRLEQAIGQGLRARVKGQGITGTSILSLEMVNPQFNPPPEISWKPRHPYIPAAPSQFSQMLSSIEMSLRNLEKLDMAGLGDGIQGNLDAIGRLLEKLEQVDFAGISTHIDEFVLDLKTSNASLQAVLDEARSTLASADFESISRNAGDALQEFRNTLIKLQPAVDGLDTMPLTETLQNTRQATEQMNQILSDLKQNPSQIIWGQPPAPARSLQPQRSKR